MIYRRVNRGYTANMSKTDADETGGIEEMVVDGAHRTKLRTAMVQASQCRINENIRLRGKKTFEC